MSVPRGSNANKTKAKQQAFQTILEYANRPEMEDFTCADIAPLLASPNMAQVHLREMVDANLLTCRGLPTGNYHFSKKPTRILRLPWRKQSDYQLGLKPSNQLGSVGR